MEGSSAPVVKHWRYESTHEIRRRQGVHLRGPRVFFVLSAMAVVLAAVGVMLSWLHAAPDAVLVPLNLANYVADELHALGHSAGNVPPLGTAVFGRPARLGKAAICAELDKLSSSTGVNAVVYLNGHALRGDDGRIHLLAEDSLLAHPETWLPLRTVLEKLKAAPCRHKLLVLDIMRPLADARLGILADEVADAIERELAAVSDDDRLVLCSCAPGETAWQSPELNGSVFGHFAAEALTGLADGCKDGERDGLVSVKELAAYLTEHVERWVRHNRGTRQTPVLLGKGDDFALAALPSTPLSPYLGADVHDVLSLHLPMPKEMEPTVEAARYPEWLAASWKRRDEWLANGSHRLLPHLVQQHQLLMLAAEESWTGAANADAFQRIHGGRIAQLEKRIAESRQRSTTMPLSLAQAAAQGMTVDPAATHAVQQFFVRLPQESVGARPAEASQVYERLVGEFRLQTKDCSDYSLAAAAFEHALSSDCTPHTLRLLDGLLQRPTQRQPRFVETLLLRQLVNIAEQTEATPGRTVKSDGPTWSDTARLALQVCAKKERLLSNADVFPWLAPLLDEATQLYHDGEIRLAAHGYANPNAAHARLAGAESVCSNLLAHAEKIQRAQRLLDHALLLLPTYARYLDHAVELQYPWEDAVLATRDLYLALHARTAALAGKDAPPLSKTEALAFLHDSGAECEKHVRKLTQFLEPLNKPFTKDHLAELKAKSDAADAGVATYQEMNALLSIAHPHLTADDRVVLFEATRQLGCRLHQRTNDAGPAPTALSVEADSGNAAAMERSLRRARTAIALLELAGMEQSGLQTLVDVLQGIERRAEGPSWAGLGNAIRKLWTARLSEQATAEMPVDDLTLSYWVMPPFARATDNSSMERCPTVVAALARQDTLRSWRGQHYLYVGRDYRGLGLSMPSVENAVLFYAQEAATQFGGATPIGAAELDLQLAGVDLRHPASTAKVRVKRTQQTGTVTPLSFEVLDPDNRWLRIAPQQFELPAADSKTAEDVVPLQVTLNVATDATEPPAPGFLVRVGYAGRFFHHAVATPVTISDTVQLLVSADPARPSINLKDIRIPPNATTACHLFVLNGSYRTRKTRLEVSEGNSPLALLPLELRPFELRRVNLNEQWQHAKPRIVTGPFTLRLLDLDSGKAIDARQLAVVMEATGPANASPSLRLALPQPTPDQEKLTVKLLTDNAPPTSALEVMLERPGEFQTLSSLINSPKETTQTETLKKFPTAKNSRIELAAGDDGALVFSSVVRDWSVEMDTSLLAGAYVVRARLLDALGNTISEASDKLQMENKRVRIVEAPAKAVQGSAIEVRALAADTRSEITSVEFFVGVPEQGKVPLRATSMSAHPINPQKTFWAAQILLPEDRKGVTPVTVAVTNGAGETTFDTISLQVAEGERSALGRIEGVVQEAARPQPGLTVQLLDDSGREVDRNTTGQDGSFAFRNLVPGRYQVVCNKPASRRRAQLAIIVEANKKTVAPLALGL